MRERKKREKNGEYFRRGMSEKEGKRERRRERNRE